MPGSRADGRLSRMGNPGDLASCAGSGWRLSWRPTVAEAIPVGVGSGPPPGVASRLSFEVKPAGQNAGLGYITSPVLAASGQTMIRSSPCHWTSTIEWPICLPVASTSQLP